MTVFHLKNLTISKIMYRRPDASHSLVLFYIDINKCLIKKYYGFKDIVYQSYELCGQEGHETGDGITPLTSSLGLPGAEQVTIKDVMHGPEADHYGKNWYGSEDILPLWINYLDH